MPESEAQHLLVPPSRRRFLAQLGVLAGAGVIAPFVRKSLPKRIERVEVGRPALGTWVRVVVQDGDAERASRAVEKAFAAIKQVDALMSIHRPDSQLSKVNAVAGRGAIVVDIAVLNVMGIACEAAQRTQNVYDPTILPLMKLYGFYASGHETFPTDVEIAETLDHIGSQHVLIDRTRGTLGLAKSGVALDFGSIGKGWALDRAVDAIKSEGISSALVDVGGNVYALGAPADNAPGWSIGIVHPVSGGIEKTFILRDMAVSTSANNEQNRMLGHIRVGHLFNAKQGRPADGHLSATVTSRTGVHSDVLSTVAFLLGPDKFIDYPGAAESHFIG